MSSAIPVESAGVKAKLWNPEMSLFLCQQVRYSDRMLFCFVSFLFWFVTGACGSHQYSTVSSNNPFERTNSDAVEAYTTLDIEIG